MMYIIVVHFPTGGANVAGIAGGVVAGLVIIIVIGAIVVAVVVFIARKKSSDV